MLWYWLVFISLLFFAFCEQFDIISRKESINISRVYIFLWIFISTIRWNGTLGDWQGYFDVFSKYITVNSFAEIFNINYWFFEPGYYIALRAIRFFTNSYTVLLLFMALLGIGGFYIVVRSLDSYKEVNGVAYGNKDCNIITILLIFWCTSCGNIYVVRTNMATVICLYSLRYIEERNIKKFVLTICVALMFHFTSIVFFVAYPMYQYRLNLKIFFAGVLGVLSIKMIGITRIINYVGASLGGRYAEKITSPGYSDLGIVDFNYLKVSGLLSTIKAASNTILVILLILFMRKYIKNDKRFDGITTLYFIGVAIQAVLLTYNMQVARIAVYFLILQCFILPYIFVVFKKVQNKFFAFAGLTAYMALKLYALINSAEGYAEYSTIFQM